MDKSTKISRENLAWLFEQPIDIKISLLTQHLTISQLILNQILEEEVINLSGPRYSHEKPHFGAYSRYGFNPGSVRVGDKKVAVDVPRVVNNQTGHFEKLQSYEELKQLDEPTDQLVNGVLYGLSTRDYHRVVDHLAESFGLSKSSVSNRFIEATSEKLKEFSERKFDQMDILAIFMDGKHLAKQQIIIALAITAQGDKIPLGFVQSTTENSVVIGSFLKDLINRGLKYEDGILFIVDGSKGMKKAIQEVFEHKAIIQRCTWHKRENILSYLPENLHATFKLKYHKALQLETYQEAKDVLLDLVNELKKINLSAANSLLEGMEELLTLHKLGLNTEFWVSFSTTNCIESVNSQIRKYAGRVKNWSSSDQRYRWMAAALLEIEYKLRKVDNFRNLKIMKEAIKKHIQNQIAESS